MDFLIQPAFAQDAAASGGGLASLIPLVLLFVVFYFLLIRPQTKRVKEHKQMVEALAKGDEVVTNGGLLGKITELGDNFLVIEIATGVEVKIQRMSVAAVLPKGTMKTL
ncbi:preprotein translocase subunit YajC [Thioflexithrix psekupsensis]|uniref:Sec translocon accessory complex subunit YajC n=1 Tax=Thioflexithrix psekupsensis TaxID=1570016 RepID=A0A251XDA4_9GAMM|nr:preprotein translocase subunit YajC [Thioflexithrix psekupsensis]OUD16200.1 preprotein translocase subunit YajC [Thioflexithrix psekupsensis]